MASRGTCTLLREMSEALAGLPWRGDGWEGDREWNSGLPGAEPWPWALMWARAGEPGVAWWSREGEAGEPCLVTWRGVAAVAGIPKLPPLAITWLGKRKITESGSLWEHKAQQTGQITQNIKVILKLMPACQEQQEYSDRLEEFVPLLIRESHHGQVPQVLETVWGISNRFDRGHHSVWVSHVTKYVHTSSWSLQRKHEQRMIH